MSVEFRVRTNVDGIGGYVIDFDVVNGQQISPEEAAAIAASEAADATRRIELKLHQLGEDLAHVASQVVD